MRPAVAAVGDRRADPVAGLLQRGVGQTHQVHTGQARGDVGLDFHDLVRPVRAPRPRTRAPAPSADPLQVGDLRACAGARSARRSRRCESPPSAASWPASHKPGQPAQPADLARGDRVRQPAVTVAGAGLHLDEHHRAAWPRRRRSRRVRRSGSASCGARSATPSASGDPRRAPRPSLPVGPESKLWGSSCGQCAPRPRQTATATASRAPRRPVIPSRASIHTAATR